MYIRACESYSSIPSQDTNTKYVITYLQRVIVSVTELRSVLVGPDILLKTWITQLSKRVLHVCSEFKSVNSLSSIFLTSVIRLLGCISQLQIQFFSMLQIQKTSLWNHPKVKLKLQGDLSFSLSQS